MGLFAVALSAACAGCYFLPGLLVRLSVLMPPGASRGEAFAQGTALVGGFFFSVAGAIGCGAMAVIAAGLAMNSGQRGPARLSLLIVLGVLLVAMRAQQEDHRSLPAAAPTQKLDPDCVGAALAGELPPPKCRPSTPQPSGPLREFKPARK